MVQLLTLFGLDGKLTQIADVAADAVGDVVEHDAQEQCQTGGIIDIGVVSLKGARQLGRIRNGSTHDDVAEEGGRIEIGGVGRLRQALDVVAVAVAQRLLDFRALQVVAQRVYVCLVTVKEYSPLLIDDGHTEPFHVLVFYIVAKQAVVGQAVLAKRLHHLVVVHLKA